MIEIMQAYLDGKGIEVCNKASKFKWVNTVIPSWDWISSDYRIKPKPKELWVNEIIYDDINTVSSLAYQTKEDAINRAGPGIDKTAVHYKEVL